MEGPGCCNTVCSEGDQCTVWYDLTRSSDWREIIGYSSLLKQIVRKWSLLFLGRLTEFNISAPSVMRAVAVFEISQNMEQVF